MNHRSFMVVLALTTLALYACGSPFTAEPFAESGLGGAGSPAVTLLGGAGSAGNSGESGGGASGAPAAGSSAGGMGGVSSAGSLGTAGSAPAGCGGEEDKPIDQRQCIERIECGKYQPFASSELCQAQAERLAAQNCPPTENWVQNLCPTMPANFVQQMDCSGFAGCIP